MSLLVGVVLERRRSNSKWVDFVWSAVAVLAGEPEVAVWSAIGAERFFAGMAPLEFHRTDTATYRDNLASGNPRVWVRCRMESERPVVIGVTADPAEGEAFTEAGDDLVDSVPMPGEVAAALAAFVAEHHVERVFLKRKRDRGFVEDDDE
jgi:hypothetical protein